MSVRYFYVDESFDSEKFCLSAIGIKHTHWHDCFRTVQEHRRNLKADHGIYLRKEIHARDFVAGRGQISPTIIGKHTRVRLYLGLLNLVAQLPEVMIVNVCLDAKGRRDPQLDAWDRLLNRIERTMLEFESRELPKRKSLVAAALKPDVKEPDQLAIERRLLSYAPRAMIFADKCRESEITRAFRKMTVFNPIPSKHGNWTVGRTKNIPLERIIEDPVFKDSARSYFVQLADCVAFGLLKRETLPTPNIKKYGVDSFFESALSGVCFRPASPAAPLGIVRK